MAISQATAAAASRIMAHSKTSLQALIRRNLLPVQSMNGSTGSLLASLEPRPLRGPDDSVEYHRSTGSPSLVQFRFGPAGDWLASQARIEARVRQGTARRPTKQVDSDDDSDDGGDSSDDSDFPDHGDSRNMDDYYKCYVNY